MEGKTLTLDRKICMLHKKTIANLEKIAESVLDEKRKNKQKEK